MTINLDEITRALAESTQGRIGTQFVDQWYDQPQGVQLLFIDGIQRNVLGAVVSPKDAHLIAHDPEWLRLLVERVRKLELDVMRVDVVLEAAKAVVEDGNYDVHFENRSAALIDSGLLLRMENAVNALSVKEST